MLSYFPTTYPDELLYSLLARYHRHTCSTSPKRTLEDLFGSRNIRATVDLPGHLAALSRRLPADRGLTPERLATDFTLFPYHTAFQPPTVVADVLATLIDGKADGIHLRLGIAATTVSAPAALRYCPLCHAEALARWGERFWRRAHQLPGVLVCPDHGAPLLDSTVVPGHGHQHAFIAADEDTSQTDDPAPAWAKDAGCRTILRDIARRSAALLSVPPKGAKPTDLTARYRNALIDRQFAFAHGRVDQRRLRDAFTTLFAPACSALAELPDTTWLASIARKHRHAFHPLHHILFGLFLDHNSPATRAAQPPPRRVVASAEFANRLRDLVIQGASLRATARALAVDPNTVRLHTGRLGLDTPWRPLIRPKADPKADAGPAIRERWLELQRQQPQLGRKALADQRPAEHMWLYRHDQAWLESHSPAVVKRAAPRARVDWTATDRDLAVALRESAESFLSRIPPVQVTLAALERQLGHPGWIEKRRSKLPETLAVLASLAESVEAFQLRRVAWARQTLEQSEGSAPVWKIHRLAKLPSRLSPAVRQALSAIPPPNVASRNGHPPNAAD